MRWFTGGVVVAGLAIGLFGWLWLDPAVDLLAPVYNCNARL